MATLQELQSAYATLGTIFRTDLTPRVNAIKQQVDGGAGFAAVASEINSVRREFDNAYARVAEILQQAQQLSPPPTEFIAQLERSINTNQSTNRAAVANIEIQARANQDTDDQAVKDRAAADQGPRTTSAGAIQAESETARDDQALTQNPPAARQVIDEPGRITDQAPRTVPVNAQATPTTGSEEEIADSIPPAPPVATPGSTNNQSGTVQPGTTDVGADGVVRPGETYRRTPDGGLFISTTGVGNIPRDDNVPINVTQTEITQRFQEPLVPRPNILDQYASYTYSISMYLMSPERYRELLERKKKSVDGMQLLIQSGGADIGQRNEFFDLDFYIDNLNITSYVQGKGTRSAHNVTEMQFRITEPYGITFLSRLFRATQKYVGGDPEVNKNYAAQHFLMVIRFYGYDANGQRITPESQDPAGSTDRQAVIEKFIPFRFTDIKFSVGSKVVEYQCSAVAPQNDLLSGRARGILPFAVTVKGGTLEGLLTGPVTSVTQGTTTRATSQTVASGDTGEIPGVTTFTGNQTDPGEIPGVTVTASAPATAGSASARTITSGLEQALNQHQASFVTQGIYDIADRYFFKIIDNSLRNAQVQPRGPTDLSRTAPTTPQTAADAKDGSKQKVSTNTKFVSGYPGQSIVQFIDLLIRNSTYIYDQEVIVQTTEDGKKVQRAASTPAWYHIGLEAKPRKYDPKRGECAYDFIYTINIYKINEMVSDYFPQGRYSGVHKAYEYWFTGLNTQILDFTQDYNYLYYLTVNTRNTVPTQGLGRLQEVYKRAFAAQSPESKQGGAENTGEPGANAADFLYSPGDLARVKLSIVGDPDWIQQGSLIFGGLDQSVTESQYVNFVSDGSINFDTQEIVFSVGWNRPADYDISTGLIQETTF